MYSTITLKLGRQDSMVWRHPWIFSGALEHVPTDVQHGDFVHVADSQSQMVGTGSYSNHGSIAVRLFAFSQTTVDQDWLEKRFMQAGKQRELLGYGSKTHTTGYRLIFGEADGLPGLVVDRYGDVLVMQISTAALETIKQEVVDALVKIYQPKTIVERSDVGVRAEENLSETHGLVYGKKVKEVKFLENGYKFTADVWAGQKTGFYLDQKDLRLQIQKLAKGRQVLNLFSYTGAASVYALLGGAESVHNVDSSQEALDQCQALLDLNKIKGKVTTQCADIFGWLASQQQTNYDMVILDPPGLIKSQRDVEAGKKAYHFLNRAAMRVVKDGGLLVTSSCSHFLPEEDLAFILRRASVQAKVDLQVLNVVRQSPDHPQSIYFPESLYLKSYILQVKK